MTYVFLCIVLIGLVVLAKYLAHRGPKGKMRITGRMPLDNRYALVSVIWEKKEYLLLLGPQGSLVVAQQSSSLEE